MSLLKKQIIKVEPKEGENESDYMGRCVPAMIEEGKEQEQAVAMCMSMYGKGMKAQAEAKKEKEWQDKFDVPLKGCKPKEPKK